jgi:hypothetical protein
MPVTGRIDLPGRSFKKASAAPSRLQAAREPEQQTLTGQGRPLDPFLLQHLAEGGGLVSSDSRRTVPPRSVGLVGGVGVDATSVTVAGIDQQGIGLSRTRGTASLLPAALL